MVALVAIEQDQQLEIGCSDCCSGWVLRMERSAVQWHWNTITNSVKENIATRAGPADNVLTIIPILKTVPLYLCLMHTYGKRKTVCSGHFQFWEHFRFYWNIASRGIPPQSWPMCPNKRRALLTTYFLYDFGNSVLTRWFWDSLLDLV